MDQVEYDALIQRSNEINAEKTQLKREIDKGKVKYKGRNITARLEQLDREHEDIKRRLNEMHST